VLANAETPEDVKRAFALGADGIGLCRTEHMFFAPRRLDLMRKLVLADSPGGRREVLQKMLPLQQQDFLDIFRLAQGKQVTIRLLDPPLHEFLPNPRLMSWQVHSWILACFVYCLFVIVPFLLLLVCFLHC
jgi:pyruvate,orthophosphate dikinase